MRIEDYWYDEILYEAEYIILENTENRIVFFYMCCSESTKKKYLKELLNNKNIVSNSIRIYELYEMLVDKELGHNDLSLLSNKCDFFRVIFKAISKNGEVKVEKNIVVKENSSYEEVSKSIKNKFLNVLQIIEIQHIFSITRF